MKEEDIKMTSVPWKNIANLWNTYFSQPSRVSEKESKKYKEWLKKIKEGKMRALVLGVTPEIRKSLAELNYDVTCIDINPEMIQAMESILKVKNPNEAIVNENWLENTLKDNSFDVVIGDAILSNVKWEERDKLLSEVKRVLKPKGIFLTRIFTMPRKKPYKTIQEILDQFSNKKPNYKSAIELVFELQIFCYNPKDHKGTFSEPKKVLEKIRGKDGFNFEKENLNKILDMVWEFWCGTYLNKIYYYPLRDEEEERLKKFFKIVKTFETDDQPYGKITPIYFLRTL